MTHASPSSRAQFLLPALLCLGLLPSAYPAQKTVTVGFRIFPGLAEMDGNWAALKVAHDGKVYAGLACHGCDGHLVFYDPRADRMVDVGNLTRLCGEQGLGIGPQSKIHFKFGEGKDGRIYFATHAGLWWDYARVATPEGYPGAHWMAYDPQTGRVENFGIGPRYEGINTGAYDPVRNRLYGLTHPRGHLVYFDVPTRTLVDKGRINNWESICRTLGIDDRGNVYGSFGLGRIYKYDPRSDSITEVPLHIPFREKGVSLGRDYYKSETAWRVVVWDGETRRFYGVEESASLLFSFDPYAGEYGQIKVLGQLCIPSTTVPTGLVNVPANWLGMPLAHEPRDIPYATLALALGSDRKLYFGASESEFDYAGSGRAAGVHLISYDLSTGHKEDLGEMRLPDGRLVLGVNSADPAPDGTIYFVGAIEVPKTPGGRTKAAGTVGGVPYRLALLFYPPGKD